MNKKKNSKVKLVSAVAVFTLAAGMGMAAIGDEPEVLIADSYGQGDGLNRYVLTLVSTAASGVSSAGARPSAEKVSSSVEDAQDESQKALDLELFKSAQIQWGPGEIVAFNNRVYYLVGDNAIDISTGANAEVYKLSDVSEPASTTEVEPPVLTAEPTVKETAPVEDSAIEIDAPLTHPAPDALALASLSARTGIVSAQVLSSNEILISTTLELSEVKAFSEVQSINESVEVPVFEVTPTDPMYANYSWSLNNTGSNAYQQTAKAGSDISAEVGWDVSQGQDTVIAVIDTGFDSDHPDLIGSLWSNPSEACGSVDTNANGKAGDCHGWNFYTNSSNIDNGALGTHGTSVSGAAAARINNGQGSAGVAPKAKIMPLVVGGGESINIELASEAIRYAADNGADVINASFGGVFSGQTLSNLSSAVDYAASKGVLVVAAAGNDGANRDTNLVYPASLPNPGVLTVGSTDASDLVAGTSAYGQTTVDIFAPGEKIFTTWNDGGYRLVSGTSIAAPHVAGAVALYKSVQPGIDAAALKAAIMADSDKLSNLTAKSVSGGRLNVGKIQAAGANPNENISYTFSSMNAQAGAQSPKVSYVSTASNGSYSAKLGLAMKYEGEIWAVSGEDITLNGTTLTTNDLGEATFPLGTKSYLPSGELNPGLSLGEGDYALTVQILKNEAPMTRPYAAPLMVGSDTPTDPGTGTPSPTDPGTGTPAPTDPGTGTPNPTPTDPGAGTPNPTDPGTGTPAPTDPGTGTPNPTPTDPGTGTPSPTPTDPGTGTPTPNPTPTDPGTGTPSPTDPGTGTPNPTPTDPGTGTPSPTPTDPGTPSPTPSPTPSDPGTPTQPSGPTTKNYDQVGDFKVTSISPINVGLDGGESITITGLSLEAGVGVRIGATRVADVIVATSNMVIFKAPSAVAGTYDVTVFKNGKSSVLSSALIYSDQSVTPAPTDPGTGTPTPNPTDPGTGTPNPTPTDPGTGTPSPTPTDPGSGTPTPGGSTPSVPNATKVGPNGERLVRNDSLSSLSGLWATECSTSCSGMQV